MSAEGQGWLALLKLSFQKAQTVFVQCSWSGSVLWLYWAVLHRLMDEGTTATVLFPHCKRWDGSLWCRKVLQEIYSGKVILLCLPDSISSVSYYGTKGGEHICFKVKIFRQNITTGASWCEVSRLEGSASTLGCCVSCSLLWSGGQHFL